MKINTRYKVVCNDKNNKFSLSIFFSYFSSLASHRLLAQAISRICQFQTFMRITLFYMLKLNFAQQRTNAILVRREVSGRES